jgi:hypothetical protein
LHSAQTLLHVVVAGERYHYYTIYRLGHYRWRARCFSSSRPAPQDILLLFTNHSCDARQQLNYTHTDSNTATTTMGFSPFKKSDKDLSEARSPTPPEYDNSHERGLPGVAREKKCVLINREIDNNGFGRYQWYIWSLCGLGYFIDLIWAQAFGLILGPLQQELGFPGTIPDSCS